MTKTQKDLIEKLETMIALARTGDLETLAYHYKTGPTERWGFIGLSEVGQLVAGAKLCALATQEPEPESENFAGEVRQ